MEICSIKHPLKNEPGSSQFKRANDALQAAEVSIDGRSLADILEYLYRYARQVNFQEYLPTEDAAILSDWSAFFEKSLPFLLARISKLNTDSIEQSFQEIQLQFGRMPSPSAFNALLNYCFEEAIQPVFSWFEALQQDERYYRDASGTSPEGVNAEFRFKRRMADLVSAELNPPLKEFIRVYRESQQQLVVTPRNFIPFVNQQIWGLKLNEIVALERLLHNDLETLAGHLNEQVFSKFLTILRQIAGFAADYLPDSLHPLQETYTKRHEPHLALLFTFLELFKYVQGDLNRLSEKHLDFFYKQVLRIQPKPHRPDHAHLVFETAKHLEQYLIKKDTLFKNGKDANKTDLLYGLEEEIVIDKAAVERLSTLYLHQAKVFTHPKKPGKNDKCIDDPVIALEGVYMAPAANSADGRGLPFPENQIPNWPTLGARENKINAPGKTTPGRHPYARLGLVLASPVLLLNEGRREIGITICCNFNGNQSIKESCLFFKKLDAGLKQPYFKLTEGFLQTLPHIFSNESLTVVEQWQTAVKPDNLDIKIKEFILQSNFSSVEKKLLEFYLTCSYHAWQDSKPPAGSSFLNTAEWLQLVERLGNPLSDAARAYLAGLLASHNPYYFGYDLEGCLDVNEEPSCKPLFSPCEKKMLHSFLERDDRGLCILDSCNFNRLFENHDEIILKLIQYFPGQFPKEKPKKCLPVFLDIEQLKQLRNEDKNLVFNEEELEIIGSFLICDRIFNVFLSGKEGWHTPNRVKTELVLNAVHMPVDSLDICQKGVCPDAFTGDCGDVQFKITIALDEDAPPIVCFDKEKLQEDYQMDQPWPAVKIELNNELKLDFREQECNCCRNVPEEKCCLAKDDGDLEGKVSLYHFFRDLLIIDTKIDVKVCGVKKNIVVQNDENILDPNSPFQPFGVRPVVIDSDIKNEDSNTIEPEPATSGCPSPPIVPKINVSGPNFYLGSNEVFRKCWKDLCIHLNWKDKPGNLAGEPGHYYEAYDPGLKLEDFEVNISVLEGGTWKGEKVETQPKDMVCCPDDPFDEAAGNDYIKRKNPCTLHYNRELFKDLGDGCACKCPKDLPPYPSPFPYEQTIKIESRFFSLDKEREKNVCKPIGPYQVDTKDGFIRLTLENQDFFHDQYAYILSRQMIAMSRYPEIIPDAVYVGRLPEGTARAINVKDLLQWICYAKDLADDVLDNAFDNDLTALHTKLNELVSVGGSATLTANDIQQLGTFVDAVGTELANLNPSGDQTAMNDFIVFFNFWGNNPTMPTDAFGNIIFDPANLGLKGWFERLKDHFSGAPDSVFSRITELKNLVGNVADLLDLDPPELVTSLFAFFKDLHNFLEAKCEIARAFGEVTIPIPNEPWTPTIKNISLDYSACATKEEIDLIHLYPFEKTFKHEDLESLPPLLPVFKEEGALFLGLNNLRPGSMLNLLFQLADATADSERDRALVHWHYLANNQWRPLRTGFEVVSDQTNGLTVSGIIKIALPRGISRTGNTVMPSDLYWIKASVSEDDPAIRCPSDSQVLRPFNKVKAVSETIAVHTQAAKVIFKPDAANDLQRLVAALPAGSITKMAEPEAGVKKIEQPYPSFRGMAPESGGVFYKRVSEQLRHKGRAIAGFDYEALVLDAFPQIFKVKCINHDFGLPAGDFRLDMELAPGFVTLAVIPDLTKLTPGQGLEPRAPVSILEEIKTFLKKRISPFIRLKVLNPRYEKVNLKIHVRLRKGKDKAYYGSKLKEDLTYFFAPWFITKDSDKLVFGQSVSESEVIRFVEKLEYVDFITCLSVAAGERISAGVVKVVEPLTARSILTAGEICVFVNDEDCDTFSPTELECLNIHPKGTSHAYPFHKVCEKEEEIICPPEAPKADGEKSATPVSETKNFKPPHEMS